MFISFFCTKWDSQICQKLLVYLRDCWWQVAFVILNTNFVCYVKKTLMPPPTPVLIRLNGMLTKIKWNTCALLNLDPPPTPLLKGRQSNLITSPGGAGLWKIKKGAGTIIQGLALFLINFVKVYHKRGWSRKEGRGNKDFKKGGKLDKGGGPPYELCPQFLHCISSF